MKSIFRISTTLAAVIWLVACGTENKPESTEKIPMKVVVQQVEEQDFTSTLLYAGQVVSLNQSVLSTKTMGQVSQVLVKAGDHVSVGDLLVTIKSKGVNAQLASAKAMLDEAIAVQANADKSMERMSNLKAQGSATQEQLDQAMTARDMANARVNSARHQVANVEELLSYANIRSHIDGFVSAKYVNPGDMANPGSPLLALESTQQLKIDINVPEFEVGLFNEGDEVTIYLNAFKDQTFKGFVDKVIPSSAYSGTQFKVSVLMENAPKSVMPGMFGRVERQGASIKKVIIPASALNSRGQLTGVFVISDQNEAMQRWLRLGRESGQGYEVLAGLDLGEQFIVSSEGLLKDGMKVTTTKSK
ncbi:MAG: efflux RND transporter periplasmic adaptor subunit [Reichenbachiella sp.]|uniref:efflux RND transporter periplasmic adaptor subunit n=1 Tax=Reichenbachiella sp. TaxID=2184521 RepID=UPI0032995FEE